CADLGKISCHKSLLPHSANGLAANVSRAVAEKDLHAILVAGADAQDPDSAAWVVTEQPTSAFDTESALEQQFRAVLSARLETLGATVKVQPTSNGDEWAIQCGGRSWRLEPQVLIANCKPDFVLRCSDPLVPGVAIFTDGWAYHASPTHNRLADDAEKRQGLRELGYRVLVLTWQDLDGDGAGPGPWLTAEGEQVIRGIADLKIGAGQIELLRRGPLELLLSWIQKPDVAAFRDLARALPLALAPAAHQSGSLPANTSCGAAAAAVLGSAVGLGEGSSAWWWRSGPLAVLCRRVPGTKYATEIALVLDDTVDLSTEEAKAAWRYWLELSNLAGFRDIVTITGRSLVLEPAQSAEAEAAKPAAGELGPEWEEALSAAAPQEIAVLEALAAAGVSPPGDAEEVDGIPLAATWPAEKVTIDVDFTDEERSVIVAAGWHVVPCELSAVLAALTGEKT
nr:hypothetical protein [Baekduia sp.]